ncbi:MAG: hypothetical protein NC302_04470 [Bacteroidales bacterium]|nr:hypothetical protein [Bacteroidales bacterium]MCM1415417.1 hypothetical protein [bacterium]MCM1422937.1 hypothetical protein [bacterium]
MSGRRQKKKRNLPVRFLIYLAQEYQTVIDHCIENGILKEFLAKNRVEVLGMLLEEFDAEKYERTIRSEGWEEGNETGRIEGRNEGIAQLNLLVQILMAENRLEDLRRSTTDAAYREELFQEFEIG